MLLFALLSTVIAAAPVIEPLTGDGGTPGVRCTFDVDAPAATVLDLLWDVSQFQKVFPDIKELHIEGTPTKTSIDVRFVVDAVVASRTYTLRRQLDREHGNISWRNIAGDLPVVVGRWHVADAGGRSLVSYESYVDVGVPGVSTIYRNIVLSKLQQMVQRVRTAAKP
jgi:carbon monoxide dehydrogenase subunit G